MWLGYYKFVNDGETIHWIVFNDVILKTIIQKSLYTCNFLYLLLKTESP